MKSSSSHNSIYVYIYKSPWNPIKSSFNTEFHRWVWRLTYSWIVEPCQKRIRRLQTVTQGERQDVRREPEDSQVEFPQIWSGIFGTVPKMIFEYPVPLVPPIWSVADLGQNGSALLSLLPRAKFMSLQGSQSLVPKSQFWQSVLRNTVFTAWWFHSSKSVPPVDDPS